MTAPGRGDSRATIIDIARLAGVSKSTVSLVLKNSPMVKDETRARVEAVMGELGYVYNRAAANLRMARSNFVGMIISDLMNPFFSEMAAGIEEALYRAGYVPILANTNEDPQREAQVLQSMREQGVAGIIISPTGLTDADSLAEFRHSHIPVVTIARRLNGAHLAYIGQDNVNGAFLATQYLLELGHKTIAFLGGTSSAATQRERMQGHRLALEAAGMVFQPNLVFETAPTRRGGREAAQAMLASQCGATAALCFNDVVAFGVIHALSDCGIEAGRDFSVIGFDNIAESEFHRPPLTTITAHTRTMGEHGAHILLSMIEHPNQPIYVLIEPAQLIIRESCAPLQLENTA
jgi:LacI family transcriptional regulator